VITELTRDTEESTLKLSLENRDRPGEKNVQKGSIEIRKWVQLTAGYRYLPAPGSYLSDPALWNPLGPPGRSTGSAFLSFPAGRNRIGIFGVEKSAGAGFFLVHPHLFLAVHPGHGSAALASSYEREGLRFYSDITFFTRTERLENYSLPRLKRHRDGEGSFSLESRVLQLEAVRRSSWDLLTAENGQREKECSRCGKSGYANILSEWSIFRLQGAGQDRAEHQFRWLSVGLKWGERWQWGGEARAYRYRSYLSREMDPFASPRVRAEDVTRSAALHLGWQNDGIFLQFSLERSYEERYQGRIGIRSQSWNAAAGFVLRTGKEERDFLLLDTSTHPDGRLIFTRRGRSLTFLQLDSRAFYSRIIAESGPDGMSYQLQLHGQLSF